MNKSARRIALGTAIFGAIGYVAGILTAPKSGSETRKTIRNARDSGVAEAEKQLKRLHTELSQLLGQAEDAVDAAKSAAGRDALVGEVVSKASHTRQKTREILSALHDGNADDRDLNKAVAEASKAIKSLRNYLKK